MSIKNMFLKPMITQERNGFPGVMFFKERRQNVLRTMIAVWQGRESIEYSILTNPESILFMYT